MELFMIDTPFCVYDKDSGVTKRGGICLVEFLQQQASDDTEKVAAIAYSPGFYENGSIHPFIDYSLESLPVPCTVVIEGIAYMVTEQATFEFNYPGTYQLCVDPGPRYLKKVFTIDYQA